MKKETEDVSEKEMLKIKACYQTTVGGITACPGCITEVTVKMIKYV